MVSTPMSVLKGAALRLIHVLLDKTQPPDAAIEELIGYATKARKNGLVSLENESLAIQDPFLKKALTLAVDGTDLQEIRNMMQLDMDISDSRAQAEAKVFECGGGYSPTIGIIGAVMGLIQVMKNLANIEEVGHGIAVAFVATVYGVALANILLLPAAAKIKSRIERDTELKELKLEGVIAIVEGLNPKLIRSKLDAYRYDAPAPAKAGKEEKDSRGACPRQELSLVNQTTMPRKKQEEHVNHERWLVSYADFITLLFAFFVVMFATSQVDKSKAQAVSDSVKKAIEGESFNSVVKVILGGTIDHTGAGNAQKKGPGGDKRLAKPDDKKTPPMAVELSPSLEVLTKQLAPEIKAGKLQIAMVPRGLVISFTQAALFPSGEDEIAKDTFSSIRTIAEAMNKIPNPARMEGHTDAIPIHNSRFRSNWELSAARSIALLEAITSYGVDKDRLSIGGLRRHQPGGRQRH